MTEATPTSPRSLLHVTGLRGRGIEALTKILQALGSGAPRDAGLPVAPAEEYGVAAWAQELHDDLARRYGLVPAEARPDSLLTAAHANYDNEAHRQLDAWLAGEFEVRNDIVVADPWFPWLAPLWQVAADRAGAVEAVVIVVDHPAVHVAQGTFGEETYPDVALAAEWINTMLAIELATRRHRRSLVSFADLVADWTLTVKTLGDDLGVTAIQEAQPGQLIRASERAPQPGTKASAPGSWERLAVPSELRELADATYDGLLGLVRSDDDSSRATLDTLRQRFADRYELAAATARSSIEDGLKQGRRGAPR